MNFYLDFEATQFSERIISIGCIADNGASFKTLVKPVKNEKVNAFITQLTGITNEMLENAPTADEAFNAFCDFVKTNNEGGVPTYYCYGSSDKNFIQHTVSGMSDFHAIMFASSIQALMVDYSAVVKKYLSTRGLSLKKLVALIRHVDEVEQNHDALDDAMMLKECYEGLDTLDKDILMPEPTPIRQSLGANCNSAFTEAYNKLIDECGQLQSIKMAGHTFNKEEVDYLKQLRRDWVDVKEKDFQGDATAENWNAKLTHIRTGAVKYFTEPWVAAMFLNRYVMTKRSSKDLKALNTTMKEMARNPNNFGGYRCEIICNNVSI